jgi:hypothetical protein
VVELVGGQGQDLEMKWNGRLGVAQQSRAPACDPT